MRLGSRHTEEAEPVQEGYGLSVSDVMAALVFIFIITVVVFALRLREMEEAIANTDLLRQDTLLELQRKLRERGLPVTLDEDFRVLRLPEEVLFPSGSAELRSSGRQALATLANVLAESLPCLAAAPTPPPSCAAYKAGRLDSVLFEGHTDDIPLSSTARFADNWELSAARAIAAFKELEQIPAGRSLLDLQNREGQPIIGVSAYADRRAARPNVDDESRGFNRRIELRLLMVAPTTPTEGRGAEG